MQVKRNQAYHLVFLKNYQDLKLLESHHEHAESFTTLRTQPNVVVLSIPLLSGKLQSLTQNTRFFTVES